MHITLNGWFWNQLTTGSGQYLQALVAYLPQVAPQHRYTLLLPRARAASPLSVQPGAPAQHAVDPPTLATDAALSRWQVHFAATPFDRVSPNLAKVWFEQVSFPLASRRCGADVALTPYWGSPIWRPCPTAVTVHDLIPLLLPAYRGGALQRLYTRLVTWTARRADLLLTDSQASRQDLGQHLGVPAGRVQAIPLAVDQRFRPVTDHTELARVQQRYCLPEQFILYLGGFDVRKNLVGLVRAYARLFELPSFPKDGNSDIRLVIAGRLPAADTPFTPDPRRIAAEAGLAGRVHFIGWVDEADKPALYSLARLFAFPSLYEGFGLPVAEAAACGTPVVTSRRSSLPEAAPAAVLVDPEDVGSIAAGLAQALGQERCAVVLPRTWAEVAAETSAALAALAERSCQERQALEERL